MMSHPWNASNKLLPSPAEIVNAVHASSQPYATGALLEPTESTLDDSWRSISMKSHEHRYALPQPHVPRSKRPVSLRPEGNYEYKDSRNHVPHSKRQQHKPRSTPAAKQTQPQPRRYTLQELLRFGPYDTKPPPWTPISERLPVPMPAELSAKQCDRRLQIIRRRSQRGQSSESPPPRYVNPNSSAEPESETDGEYDLFSDDDDGSHE